MRINEHCGICFEPLAPNAQSFPVTRHVVAHESCCLNMIADAWGFEEVQSAYDKGTTDILIDSFFTTETE